MKRFFGLVLTVTGGAVVLWGGYHVLTGQSSAQVRLTDGLSISALMVGLIGVLTFTMGLIWVRD